MSDDQKSEAATGEVTVEQLQAALAAERKAREDEAQKRAAAEKNYNAQSAVLKTAKDRLDAYERARQARPEPDADADDPQARDSNGRFAAPGISPEFIVNMAHELQMVRYKLDHPEAGEHWAEIMELTLDPMKVEDVIYREKDGSVNAYKTFKRAHETIVAQKSLLKKSDEPDKGTSREPDTRKAMNARATITGGGAYGRDDLPDMSGMSVEQQRKLLVERGVIQIDPDDPPSWARRSR